MSAEQLLLALPSRADELVVGQLTNHQWEFILEQFAAQGGREVLLVGAEPLGFPGFWLLVRKCLRLRIPRVTAYLSGSHLEPWVQRELVESGVHLLFALDSLEPKVHEALHRGGSHSRVMAALDAFLRLGLAPRLGILATATRLNHQELPRLAAWVAGRSCSRMLWTPVPDGGWPSPQLRALRLSPEEKAELAANMSAATAGSAAGLFLGPLDPADNPAAGAAYSRLLRVSPLGEATWGFPLDGLRLGNLRRTTLHDLLQRADQAAGD